MELEDGDGTMALVNTTSRIEAGRVTVKEN
jgi:hypothetical protein